VSAEFSVYFEDPLSTKLPEESFTNPTSRIELQFFSLWLLKTTLKGRKRWCDDHTTWTSDDWKYVIGSDESPFTLLPKSAGFMFGERRRKPIILNVWFQL